MPLLDSPVQVVRDSIATITQILAERDIPVYQRGLQAHVAYDIDGRPISVCLPYLPDDAPPDLIMSVQGFLDHEVGHLLFTDQSEILGIAHDKELLTMHNLFEDPFVERKMRGRFPGSRHNLTTLYRYFIDHIIDRNLTKVLESGSSDPMDYFGVLSPCIVRAWAGFAEFEEYLADKWELVKPVTDKIDPATIARVPDTRTTKENVEIARDVLFEIMKVPEADDTEFDEGEIGVEGASASGGGSSGSGDKSRKGGKPGRDCEVDEEGDAEDTVEADGDAGDMPDEPEPDSDEPELDDATDETRFVGDADAAEVPDSDEGAGDAEGEGEGDDGEGEDGSEEGDSEEDSKLWTPEEGESLSDRLADDIESMLSKDIAESIEDIAESSGYMVYSTDEDKVEPASLTFAEFGGRKDALDREVARFHKRTVDIAGSLYADFERSFVSENTSYWRGSQYSGRINPSQLAKLRCDDMRVFRRKVEHKTQSYDVQLVVDCSGSMHGERIKLAMEAAYTMAMALDRVGINFEIIGFTTHGSRHPYGSGKVRYARLDNILLPIFKDFAEEFGPRCLRRMVAWTQYEAPLSENVDGESVMMCARRLAAQPSKGKAMIVLSDGSPCCGSEDHTALGRHLKDTVKEIMAANIKVVGIGIQHPGVAKYYPDHVVIRSLDELPTTVVGKVREIVLG